MNDYSDVRQIIEDIKNLEKNNPELREYFKNQQRFIHLYLLSKGASVTAELINDVISTLDRGFAPKTYYSLRRELNDMEWIEEDETIKSSNVKGPVEVSHRIKKNRLNEFQKKMIEEINIVDRPFSMNKNHLFEMGLRFSKLNRQKIGELESYIKKYLNTEDSFVFPTFLTKSISNELIKAYHSVSYMNTSEKNQTMDTLTQYRQIITDILHQYAHPPSHGKIYPEIIIDSEQKHYELMYVGWDGSKRIHCSVIHIDLIDGKIWIQHDGTSDGVASDLKEAGIPSQDIILGFRPEHVRKYTGYGV